MSSIEQLFADQKAWSSETFGDHMDPTGVIDHIRKELDEIKAKPDDPEEWADMAILALDGTWRSGLSMADRMLDPYNEVLNSELSAIADMDSDDTGIVDKLIVDIEKAIEGLPNESDWGLLLGDAIIGVQLADPYSKPYVHIAAKQAKNRKRKWPDKADQDPTKAIEHVRDDDE